MTYRTFQVVKYAKKNKRAKHKFKMMRSYVDRRKIELQYEKNQIW